MVLRQFLHSDPVAASYLFGCGGRAAAAVVDPLGDVAPYLSTAEATGTRIRYVIDTHLHADHVSAGRALAQAARAEYVLFAEAATNFSFRGVHDGEVVELGNVSAKVLHTPGHTPEHICLLVTDRTRADEPWFAFTGHTLMVGDLGRTELATNAEEGAPAAVPQRTAPEGSAGLLRDLSGRIFGLGVRSQPQRQADFDHRLREAAAAIRPELMARISAACVGGGGISASMARTNSHLSAIRKALL